MFYRFKAFISPVMTLFKTLPIAVLIILLLVMLNENALYYIVGVVILPLIFEATINGLEAIDGNIIDEVKMLSNINFTIVKNITARTGERVLYVRIAKPDNDILCKNESDTFPYENRKLTYSIKKSIEYTGEEQNVTVYWDVEEYLPEGTYNAYIFADGTLIGQQAFSMK